MWRASPDTLDDEGAHEVGAPSRLVMLGPIVSLDVETDGIDPMQCNLLCVGLSDGARTLVIWPWCTVYATPLSTWLGAREVVVGHNLHNYDLLVLERHGVTW